MIDITKLRCIGDNVDIDEYIVFRENVKKNMDNPDWLGDFTKDELVNLLNTGSKIWIYCLDNNPVCSMMFIPSTEQSLQKFGITYDCKEVADYGPMFVNPKYVGNRLQSQMLNILDDYCVKHGYKYAASTVHPNNLYSINNLLKHHFELIGSRKFKRGDRNIYLKSLLLNK